MYSSLDMLAMMEQMNGTTIFNSGIKEPEIDRQASTFISEHFNELVKAAFKMGVDPNKCEDIVQDVALSIFRQEEFGEGFNENNGKLDEPITVREFVFGRLKGYSANIKYRKPTEAPIKVTNKSTNKEEFQLNLIPATSLSDDVDTMSSCQKAYATASCNDDMSNVDEAESIEEELRYVLSFDRICNGGISSLLKEIDYFKMNCENKEFSNLFNFTRFNGTFKEALTDVIKFSGTNRTRYDIAIKNVLAAKE